MRDRQRSHACATRGLDSGGRTIYDQAFAWFDWISIAQQKSNPAQRYDEEVRCGFALLYFGLAEDIQEKRRQSEGGQ